MPRILPLAIALAGCAAAGSAGAGLPGALPARATIAGDQMTVVFTDGARCTATVPLAGAAEGDFAACPHPWRWQVEILRRNLLEPIFGRAVAPYARIAVTGPAGKVRRFKIPFDRDHGHQPGQTD